LRAENRPVFVNMTAAWCITCLVNERVALSTDAVKSAFSAGNIAYLKGDWTNRNPEITRILERHGRSGVPLYLLYSGRRRAGGLAANPHCRHSAAGDRSYARSQLATQSRPYDLSQGVNS
jgi:hypothetical protein